jgi:hypothetical protein
MKYIMGILLFLSACAGREINPSGLKLVSESDYREIIDTYTDKIETYSGLYNSLTLSATLLNSNVILSQVDQYARHYNWDPPKYNAERSVAQDRLIQSSEVFVSFYTPERKHDNLSKYDSIWKVFLDVDGRRYEGKISKMTQQTVELQKLYDHHTRFSTPYKLTFPVSMKKIENFPVKLVLTGPAGSAQLNFPALNAAKIN